MPKRKQKKWVEKRKKRKADNAAAWAAAPESGRTLKPAIEFKNEHFDYYYKQQNIIPEEQWEDFKEALQKPLPLTFRLSTIHGYKKMVLDRLQDKDKHFFPNGDFEIDGKMIKPCSAITWYPDQEGWYMGCNKKDLKKNPVLRNFKQFIIAQNELGNINRQEAVSMIPPLLLDVQPHHIVLDMCAAPGSKTAQLLEAMHKDSDSPTGMVIANDADPRRAYMLVHQVKRLGSPNFLVSTHAGQFYPDLYLKKDLSSAAAPAILTAAEAEAAAAAGTDNGVELMKFDRILCDVPCSGDGTLRKNPQIIKNWTTHDGMSLHPLQLQITLRAAHMLKVGGRLVYSTCSFNPMENEAIVAEVLRRGKGALRLVDMSDALPGLVRSPGLKTWKMIDKNTIHYTDIEQVPFNRRNKRVRRTMFPPTSEEESKAFQLERCLRLFPHNQDTGGFFVAVIEKLGDIPEWQPADPVEKQIAEAEEKKTKKDMADKERQKQCREAAREKQLKEKEEAIRQAKAAAAEAAGKSLDAKDDTKDAKEQDEKAEKKKEKKNGGYNQFNEDLFTPISSDLKALIIDRFGMEPSVVDELLHTRSKEERRIYYLPPPVSKLARAKCNQRPLRLVHAGLRVFERLRDGARIVQQGLAGILPLITKQKMLVNQADLITLLSYRSARMEQLTPEFVEKLKATVSNGSMVLVYDEPDRKAFCAEPLALSCHLTNQSLSLMIKKDDSVNLLGIFRSILGVDIPEVEAYRSDRTEKALKNLAIQQAKRAVEREEERLAKEAAKNARIAREEADRATADAGAEAAATTTAADTADAMDVSDSPKKAE